jgi:hypothetical protein
MYGPGDPVKLNHGDIYKAYLEQQPWPYARLLLDDDWRPMSDYVYDRRYVYAARVNEAMCYRLFIGRGGKYSTSDWWTPNSREIPMALHVNAWKPLPDGVDPYTHGREIFPPEPEKFVGPPEPVYEPGGVDVRLTPVPRDLLVAMRDGARLHERAWRWTEWTLQKPGGDPERIRERAIEALRKVVFIERDGVLPPGRLPRWLEFDWHVTKPGLTWLAQNS